MFRKYSVYLPWIIGFMILFILSNRDGPWPPPPITKIPIWDATTITPRPISTTTTPSLDVPVVVTTITPDPISTTTTPSLDVPVVATTITPDPISTTTTPSDVPVVPTTVTPEPDPKSITPSPTPDGGTLDSIDEQAVQIAGTVSPLFETSYDVKFSPTRAQGQSAAPAGGSASDIVGVVVPVAYEKQMYEDENGRKLEVQGILFIEPPLYVEIEVVVANAPIQYSRLQTGTYMVACTPATEAAMNQHPDCIAVSEQGVEFAIRPDSVKLLDLQDQYAVTIPTAEFIPGSVYACFTIRKRRICVRAFK